MTIMHVQPAAGLVRCVPRLPQPSLCAPSLSPLPHRHVRAAVSSSAEFGAADDSEFVIASIVETPRLPPPAASAPAAAFDIGTTASLLEAELQLIFSQGVRGRDDSMLCCACSPTAGRQCIREGASQIDVACSVRCSYQKGNTIIQYVSGS